MNHEIIEKTENPPKFQDIETTLEYFQLAFRFDTFLDFSTISPLPTDPWLKEELLFALSHRGSDDKEAYVCEFLIVPCLKYVWKRHTRVNLFSHVQIKANNLTLVPDYLLSRQTPTGFKRVYKPLLLTVEAKNEQFDEGWLQALLQTIICQSINENEKIPIFAVVTTGDFWQFGKLDGRMFIRHPLPLSIENPDILLGVLDALFTACEN